MDYPPPSLPLKGGGGMWASKGKEDFWDAF